MDDARTIPITVIGDHCLAANGVSLLLAKEGAFQVLGPVTVGDWTSISSQESRLFVLLTRLQGQLAGRVVMDIREAFPNTPIAFVSLVEDEEAQLCALKAGADGILDANADGPGLIQCIRDLLTGDVVVSRPLARRLAGEYRGSVAGDGAGARCESLTRRESTILELLAKGESNKSIARALLISEHTVRAHVRSIMQKLEVANRVQAAAVALRAGLAA